MEKYPGFPESWNNLVTVQHDAIEWACPDNYFIQSSGAF